MNPREKIFNIVMLRSKIGSLFSSFALGLTLLACVQMMAQGVTDAETHAGHIPMISGGLGYVHNVSGGITTLEPQIDPVLLVPFGPHVLLESRTDFTGFFERSNLTTGPFTGKVFKTVEFAQMDWLANTHLSVTVGRYLLPFGLYNERLQPIWIRNLQDAPVNATIGTRTSGSGDGFMLRGVAFQRPDYSVQYTTYFSARSGINQLGAARVAGGDTSVYWTRQRIEVGSSYQRFLQNAQINSVAAYASWQPAAVPLDVKAEYDYSHNGNGYWLESAYLFRQLSVPAFFQRFQAVARIQRFYPLNGGGNSLPRVNTQRFDAGLNYSLRDNLRLISSYGRSFSSQGNANVWNAGFTYRFMLPLWPERN